MQLSVYRSMACGLGCVPLGWQTNSRGAPWIVYNHECMPFHRPIPEDKSSNNVDAADSPKMAAPMKSLAQAESVMQIAFVMPCALVVGWGMGWCVDHFFHVHWAIAVGLVLGVIAGMVSAIRMAIQAMNTLGKPRGPK